MTHHVLITTDIWAEVLPARHISAILRRDAKKCVLEIDDDGWVKLSDLLKIDVMKAVGELQLLAVTQTWLLAKSFAGAWWQAQLLSNIAWGQFASNIVINSTYT